MQGKKTSLEPNDYFSILSLKDFKFRNIKFDLHVEIKFLCCYFS